MKMYKQEEYDLVLHDYGDPPNTTIMENFILNGSSEGLINIGPMLDGNILSLSPPDLNEETVDVGKLQQLFYNFPVSPRGPPERTVFPGEVDFQVEINASDTHRKKYLYSHLLNRIYVDMRMNFPVSFRWRPHGGGAGAGAGGGGGPDPAYVRACVVFADKSQAEKRVERCTQHTHDASNANLSQEIVKNVLHSSREMGTHGVYYCGQADLADSWYSVLVEMGPAGAGLGVGSHAYQFVCKNSCSSGINRRAVDVIFTLEDARGHVYGRQIVGARVCACPRRDIVRDEETESVYKSGKKRVQSNRIASTTNGSKKVKLEARVDSTQRADVDDTLVTLPPLQIVGSRAVVTGLEVMLSLMEQASSLRQNDPAAADKYTKSITDLRKAIADLKK